MKFERLKAILRLIATLVLIGGPLLAVLGVVAGLVGIGDQGAAGFAAGFVAGLTVLFWSLVLGGGLHLLLNIDDRLERLERKQ